MAFARDDEHLTRCALAAADGNRAALEQFVRATQRDVWRFIAHLTHVALADDLAQETFLRALRALPRFEGRSSARTWLLSIARRVIADHHRTAMRRPQIADAADVTHAADAQVTAAYAGAPGFEDIVELNLLLSDLIPERREALVLTQVLGLSYAEVAEICSCPVGTVRSRIARARSDLLAASTENNIQTGSG